MKGQKKSSVSQASQLTTQREDPANGDGPLFFFLPDHTNGEICQWFSSVFNVSKAEMSSLIGHAIDDADDYGSITFTCAEQFMMYCKAGRFHDRATQEEILAINSPKEQKRLGMLTAGFTDASWDVVKSQVVVAGNIAKFGQNSHLKRKLLATGDRVLAEASPKDWMGYWIYG